MRLDPETRYRSILPLLAGVLGAVELFAVFFVASHVLACIYNAIARARSHPRT